MDIGVWDVCAVIVKTALYAATFAAAGGGFFLCYSGALLGDDERRAIGRRIEIWVAAAVVLSALRILLTAGSLAGDASGMIDRKLIHMVWRSGEDTAVITRIAGLLLAVRAALPARRSPALAAVGAACAAMSFAWTGHAHATGDSWTVACVALHVVCAAFWIGALGPLAAEKLAFPDQARIRDAPAPRRRASGGLRSRSWEPWRSRGFSYCRISSGMLPRCGRVRMGGRCARSLHWSRVS